MKPDPIPRVKLWACLLAPFLGMTLPVSAFFLVPLGWLPSLLGVAVFIGLVSLAGFIRLLRRRYRGRSVILLGFGYLIGQTAGCFALYLAGLWLSLDGLADAVLGSPG